MPLIQFLLDSGADPNLRDDTGCTVLSMCVRNSPELVRLFLAHGADVNVRDPLENTPLHVALDSPAFLDGPGPAPPADCVEMLIKAGADVNAVNLRDQTPLSLAEGLFEGPERDRVCALLRASGAKPVQPVTTERLIEMLKSHHPEVCDYAAEQLGSRQANQAVDALIAVLADPHTAPAAAGVLANFGDPRAVEPLMACLKRAAAKEASLRENGILHIRTPDDEPWATDAIADAAVDAVIRLKGRQGAVPLFTELLADGTAARFAVKGLQKVANPQDVPDLAPRLIALLQNPHAESRGRAAAAAFLGEAGCPEACQPLMEILAKFRKEDPYELREAIAEAIPRVGDEQTILALIESLSASSAAVRDTAVEALGRMAGRRLGTLDVALARSARGDKSLGELQHRVVGALTERLQKDTCFSVRASAAEALGRMPAPEAVDALVEALRRNAALPAHTQNPEDLYWGGSSCVVRCCAEALASIGDPRAVPEMRKVMKQAMDRDDREAAEAIRNALATYGARKQ